MGRASSKIRFKNLKREGKIVSRFLLLNMAITFLIFLGMRQVTAHAESAEWIINGDFEKGRTGWCKGVAIDTTVNHTSGGSKSARIKKGDSTTRWELYQHHGDWPGEPFYSYEIIPGATYLLTYWIKGENVVKGEYPWYDRPIIYWKRYDPPYTIFSKWKGPNHPLGTYDWKKMTFKIKADSNPKATAAKLSIGYTSSTGNIWIDDVSLYRLDPPEVIMKRLEKIVSKYGEYKKVILEATRDTEFKEEATGLKKEWEAVINAFKKKEVPEVEILKCSETLIERSEKLKSRYLMKNLF